MFAAPNPRAETRAASGDREDEALQRELPREIARARTEREPDGKLATAGESRREEQVGDVGAR